MDNDRFYDHQARYESLVASAYKQISAGGSLQYMTISLSPMEVILACDKLKHCQEALRSWEMQERLEHQTYAQISQALVAGDHAGDRQSPQSAPPAPAHPLPVAERDEPYDLTWAGFFDRLES